MSGNITLTGNSTLQAQKRGHSIVLYGATTTSNQPRVIAKNPQSSLTFSNIVLDNRANYTTAADLDITGAFIFQDQYSQ